MPVRTPVAPAPMVAPATQEPQKAPEQKQETKAARRVVIGGAKAAPSLPKDVDSCLEQLAEKLLTAKESVSVTHVELGQTKLLLASWELAAFIRGGDEVSDTLQRVVAARALLTMALEHDAKKEELTQALQAARAENGLLQSRVEDAKRTKNIDAAVNLAASGKRLLAVIEEAEKK